MRPSPDDTQNGLGAVEVIASVVILSVAMIPLMEILTRSQRLAAEVDARIEKAEALENALEYMRSVNVGRFPEGEVRLGEWTLQWDAELAHEDTQLTENSLAASRTIGLYNVDMTIIQSRNGQIAAEETRQIRSVGWTEFLTPEERINLR